MRLGLWTKLTVAFVLAAVVPVGVTVYIARRMVQRDQERAYRKSVETAHSAAQRVLGRELTRIERKVKDLARNDDPKIFWVLARLAQRRLGKDVRSELDREGPQRMRHLGFEVLFITDDQGRILSAGHAPGRVGTVDRIPVQLAKARPGKATLIRTSVEVKAPGKGGGLIQRDLYAIVAAREVRAPTTKTVRQRPRQVYVAGGFLLDRALWSQLPAGPGVGYLLRGASGQILREPDGGWKRWARFAQRAIPILGSDGEPAATLHVARSDREVLLRRKSADVTIFALAGAACVIVLLLIGAVAVRRITRRLGKVVTGAEQVAGGDLSVTLPQGPRDEVGDLVHAFNKMTVDLREARDQVVRAERIAAWREIAQRIAHEIKNPLTPIQLSIETLRRAYHKTRPPGTTGDDVYGEILEESTTTIIEEVQRLRRIVTEFSKFARLPKPELSPLDVNEILRQTVGLHAAHDVDESIALELAPDLPLVAADREQLVQVVHNLLANARDAVRDQTQPEIRVQSVISPSEVGFVVADNGHGFDEETRKHIFMPYFTTKSDSRGTGLGLAIAHRIVGEHGGHIDVEGALGQGARFTVWLPSQNRQR